MRLGGRRNLLFLKKKKQKDFFNLELGRVKIPACEAQKFFAELFFKKATACLKRQHLRRPRGR
jgi:hypothetical protein